MSALLDLKVALDESNALLSTLDEISVKCLVLRNKLSHGIIPDDENSRELLMKYENKYDEILRKVRSSVEAS
jgi:hypothetical protein